MIMTKKETFHSKQTTISPRTMNIALCIFFTKFSVASFGIKLQVSVRMLKNDHTFTLLIFSFLNEKESQIEKEEEKTMPRWKRNADGS